MPAFCIPSYSPSSPPSPNFQPPRWPQLLSQTPPVSLLSSPHRASSPALGLWVGPLLYKLCTCVDPPPDTQRDATPPHTHFSPRWPHHPDWAAPGSPFIQSGFHTKVQGFHGKQEIMVRGGQEVQGRRGRYWPLMGL